jgi:hypothetical protein
MVKVLLGKTLKIPKYMGIKRNPEHGQKDARLLTKAGFRRQGLRS